MWRTGGEEAGRRWVRVSGRGGGGGAASGAGEWARGSGRRDGEEVVLSGADGVFCVWRGWRRGDIEWCGRVFLCVARMEERGADRVAESKEKRSSKQPLLVVGTIGFEPTASCSQSKRSTRLS